MKWTYKFVDEYQDKFWLITNGKDRILIKARKRPLKRHEVLADQLCGILNQMDMWSGKQPALVPIGRKPRSDKGKSRKVKS